MIEPRPTLTIGIPSYNEGGGILPTLRSLWAGLVDMERQDTLIFISDSSDSTATVRAAETWSRGASARCEISHSDTRRSLKEALNVILNRAQSDLLVCVTADVLVPPDSLRALLRHLTGEPGCDVAIGSTLPDRRGRGLASRASAWQLKVVHRIAEKLPPSAIRAEGAFWGAWREFYAAFRYRIGEGSIADDVQLAEALVHGAWKVHSAADAAVLKLPASSLRDFAVTTLRSSVANSRDAEVPGKVSAALAEARSDPLGAACYGLARAYTASKRRSLLRSVTTEYWEVATTTKR